MVRQPRLCRAFSSLEIMVAAGVTMLITLLIVETSSMAANVFGKVEKTGTTFAQNRAAFERIVNDVKWADKCLVEFPRGTPTFFAGNNTIILRQPMLDADDNPVEGSYDVVIYEFVSDGNGLQNLRRFTSTSTSGVDGTVSSPQVVARDIITVRTTSVAHELFYGNASTTVFPLISQPAGSTSRVTEQVLIGGKNRLSDGMASFSADNLTIALPPNDGVPIDVVYVTNPSEAADAEGGNNTGSLHIEMTVRQRWRDRQQVLVSKDVAFNTRAPLLNR